MNDSGLGSETEKEEEAVVGNQYNQPNGGLLGVLRRVLEKHGPVAAMLIAVSAALYTCVIIPFQEQQRLLTDSNEKLLTNTIKQAEELNAIYKVMASTQAKQGDTLKEINEHIKQQNVLIQNSLEYDKETRGVIKSFSEEVLITHPQQNQKLDEILEEVKKAKDNGSS